jgi:hypothetical protein
VRWQSVIQFKTFPIGDNNRRRLSRRQDLPRHARRPIARARRQDRHAALGCGVGERICRVFIGIAVSDLGIAGRLMAFDADTARLWSFNTTLGAPSGGGFWNSYSLDPETGEVIGPVANPFPDFNRNIVSRWSVLGNICFQD